MMITADVRDVVARRVAYLRGYGPYAKTLPGTWQKFVAIAGPLGLLGTGAMLTVVHDDAGSVPADQLRADAAVEVGDDWQSAGGLDVQVVPGGLFAVTVHEGPYDGLPQTWSALYRDWLPASGYRGRSDPCYETYENDPATTPPAELRTTLYAPVKTA